MTMSDWELRSPDDASMQQTFTLCGIRKGDGLTSNRVRFCVNYYRDKYLPTGNFVTDPKTGVQYPERALQPGVYCIARWIPPNVQLLAFPPAGVTLPAGVTVTALAQANSAASFSGP